MTSRQRGQHARRRVVLVFGESQNDCAAIKHLIRAIRPDLPDCETRREPVVLARRTAQQKKLSWAEKIEKLRRAEQVRREVVAIVVHRDCDAIEPAHESEDRALRKELSVVQSRLVTATPAFELEAWWYLWPDAVARVRSCWRKLDPRGKNCGHIENVKQKLIKDLRPRGSARSCPEYVESNGVTIALHVQEQKSTDKFAAISESFNAFREQIRQL